MEFGDFELFDEAEQAGPTKREARLEAARQASKNYKAKCDEPGWYNHASSSDTAVATRSSSTVTAFQIHAAYLGGRYDEAYTKSLELLPFMPEDTADRAQMLDLVLRSAIKSDRISEVLDVAAQGLAVASTHHGLAVSAAECYSDRLMYQDAIQAYLAYLSVRSGPTVFDQLCTTLEDWARHTPSTGPEFKALVHALRHNDAPIPSLEVLPIHQTAKDQLQDLLSKRRSKAGQGLEEQAQDAIRSVNVL